MKTKNLKFLFFASFLFTAISCTHKMAAQSSKNNVPSIVNTTWSGKDSDGDFYEYTFFKDGHVKYKTNTSRSEIVTFDSKEDIWSQNGNTVMILIGKYSAQAGEIKQNTIEGFAWNIAGKSWTWKVTKQ